MRTEDFMDLLNEVDDKFIQELYEETEFSRPAKKTSRASIVWTRWAAIAAAFALIIISSVVLMKYKSAPTVIVPDSSQHLNESMDSSVVYTDDGSPAVILDINPSIEIKINEENDQVSQLVPLNKDAEELLTNVLMTTTKVNDCVDLLLTDACDGVVVHLREHVGILLTAPDACRGDEMGVDSQALGEEHLVTRTYDTTVVQVDVIHKKPRADAILREFASLLGQLHNVLVEE